MKAERSWNIYIIETNINSTKMSINHLYICLLNVTYIMFNVILYVIVCFIYLFEEVYHCLFFNVIFNVILNIETLKRLSICSLYSKTYFGILVW